MGVPVLTGAASLRRISPHARWCAYRELLLSLPDQDRDIVRGQTFFPRETGCLTSRRRNLFLVKQARQGNLDLPCTSAVQHHAELLYLTPGRPFVEHYYIQGIRKEVIRKQVINAPTPYFPTPYLIKK